MGDVTAATPIVYMQSIDVDGLNCIASFIGEYHLLAATDLQCSMLYIRNEYTIGI